MHHALQVKNMTCTSSMVVRWCPCTRMQVLFWGYVRIVIEHDRPLSTAPHAQVAHLHHPCRTFYSIGPLQRCGTFCTNLIVRKLVPSPRHPGARSLIQFGLALSTVLQRCIGAAAHPLTLLHPPACFFIPYRGIRETLSTRIWPRG